MVRGLKIVLILGLMGTSLVLGSRPLGKIPPEWSDGRACRQPDRTVTVAPGAEAGSDGGKKAPQEISPTRGGEPKNSDKTLPVTVKAGIGLSPRLPSHVADLIKRQELQETIEKYARHYGVDQDLVWAVIRQESGFNPRAVSPKGAMGLMQLMPGTASMLGVSDAFDIEQNIAGGIKYLESCLRQFNQDVSLALAAYNAGPGNVVKYQGCPPFAETRQYVASILKAYAGESIREEMNLMPLTSAMVVEVVEANRLMGLAWKVPRSRWKIAAPQCSLGPPRWKATLLPF